MKSREDDVFPSFSLKFTPGVNIEFNKYFIITNQKIQNVYNRICIKCMYNTYNIFLY